MLRDVDADPARGRDRSRRAPHNLVLDSRQAFAAAVDPIVVPTPLFEYRNEGELPAGEPVPQDRMIHPRVEPEIAFVLGSRLEGPGVTATEALAAVKHVVGAIEVIDSRFSGYKFTMMDAIADNNSSGYYVSGPVSVAPEQLDLSLEAVLLEVDGEIVDSATGAAVHGHPAEALAFAANTLGERGLALEPGWVVLTGGMTDAVPVRPGARLAAHFTSLGSISLSGG